MKAITDPHLQISSTGAPLPWAKTQNSKLHVLVVDDFEDARKLACSILRQGSFGSTVITIEAENGVQALAVLEKEPIDFILSDWIMPEMDGLELLKEIRQREKTKKIPFIMLTAVASQEGIVKAIKAGASDYIVKPFTIQALEQKIKALLRKIGK